MKADHAEQTRLESMLDWHADLIANGHADRAGSMARRIRVDTGSSLLFAIAEAVAETLAPVAPDPGFRRHLRARLENPTACSKGDTPTFVRPRSTVFRRDCRGCSAVEVCSVHPRRVPRTIVHAT